MDINVFKKMRVKQGISGKVFYAPEAYLDLIKQQDVIDFNGENPTFLHLFVTSKKEYDERIQEILPLLKETSRLWISYKKSTNKIKYDINRDSFFDLGLRDGITPFANVALDEEWSCIGFKKA
jgi:hypothetical protein